MDPVHHAPHFCVRNDALDANNFFNNTAGVGKAPFRFNQFGVTAGGPIAIPAVYDGRNRTFWFFGDEGAILHSGQTFSGTLPTAAQREGDFFHFEDRRRRRRHPLRSVQHDAGGQQIPAHAVRRFAAFSTETAGWHVRPRGPYGFPEPPSSRSGRSRAVFSLAARFRHSRISA